MPDPYMKTVSASQALDRKTVDGESGCWIWTGAKNTHGYGHLKFQGQYWQAHRLAYTVIYGAIPAGLVIDHLCRRRDCINPTHLEAVSNGENLHRGTGRTAIRSSQTHCINGHEFTPENTYTKPNGCRSCKACNRERMRRRARS